jgi:hypothetical protein
MITTYRRHHCTRRHRKFETVAKCVWPNAEWIDGDGPYAVLAYCRVLTITLHHDLTSAEQSLQTINESACGGRCSGSHRIVRLADDLAASR